MSSTFLVVAGALLMTGVMLLFNRFYKVPLHLLLICAVMLVVTGMLGGMLMYFIENGEWGNMSFFGAVLFAPPMMYLVARIIGASPSAIVDMVCPVGMVFLAVQKISCLRVGCCAGKIVGYNTLGEAVRFPSQILEGAAALLICILLYWMVSEGVQHGRILAWGLIIYGTARFVLNLTRETTPFLFGLPAGNIWAIVAVLEGIVVLFLAKPKKEKGRHQKIKKHKSEIQ